MLERKPFDRPNAARRQLDALIHRNRSSPFGKAQGGWVQLRPYLKGVARASVAAALVAGCSTSHGTLPDGGSGEADGSISTDSGPVLGDGGPIADSGRRRDAAGPLVDGGPPSELCGTDGRLAMLSDIDATYDYDYVSASRPGLGWGAVERYAFAGVACETAEDIAGCNADREERESEAWAPTIVTTSADEVRGHQDLPTIVEFLGSINTPQEAALVVWAMGYNLPCTGDFAANVTENEGGYLVVAYEDDDCEGVMIAEVKILVGADGSTELTDRTMITDRPPCAIGRRPAGLRMTASSVFRNKRTDVLGNHFAEIAHLEASAVEAFDIMIDELTELGAPEHLLSDARAAREDEVRHAEDMGRLARRFGAEPAPVQTDRPERRHAFDIALENAVEGCVRETYGALVGLHQAATANDPEIADVLRKVADDEIRHAELSWAVAQWLEPQLSDAEREQIELARRDAIAQLRIEAAHRVDPVLAQQCGSPPPNIAVGLVDRLAQDLWA